MFEAGHEMFLVNKFIRASEVDVDPGCLGQVFYLFRNKWRTFVTVKVHITKYTEGRKYIPAKVYSVCTYLVIQGTSKHLYIL